jgi:hypothetical protein
MVFGRAVVGALLPTGIVLIPGPTAVRLRREPSAAPSVAARVSAAACLVLLITAAWTPAIAQEASASRKDSVAIGGGLGWVFMSPRWTTVSMRASAPVSPHVGFDLEVGRNLDPSDCCRIGRGFALSALARLSRSGRRPSGLMRYWVIGGVYLQQRHVSAEGDLIDRDPVKSFQVGYGWDWKPKRVRNGLEISAFLAGPHIGAVRYYVMWD